MTHAYRACLRSPYATYLLSINLLGRLPNGMVPLAIAIFLRSHHVGFSAVGAITALYGLSMAIGGPMLGRAVDRFGQPVVLVPSAVGSAAGMLWLTGSGSSSLVTAALAACVSGAFSPPLEPCLRTIWPDILPDRETVSVAYALDASLQQFVFVGGPLLVVLISTTLSTSAVLPLTALAMLVGTAAYVIAEPVRRWRAEPRQSDWAGPLRSSVMRLLLLSLGCVGIGLGSLNIATVAYQEHIGFSGLSGILLGVNALGALVGGLAHGARRWRLPIPRQLVLLLLGSAACYLPLVLVAPPLPTAVLILFAGFFLAPILTCGFGIIAEVAPRGTATEAFAWMVTAVLSGNAVGSSLAGLMQQHVGIWAVFLIPGLATVVSLLVAIGVDRQPVPRPEPRQLGVGDPRRLLIVSDLDGTLLDPAGQVSRRTRDAVRAVLEEGHLFAIATSRPVRDVRPIAEALGQQTLALCGNGSISYDFACDEVVDYQPLLREAVAEALSAIRSVLPTAVFGAERRLDLVLEDGFVLGPEFCPADVRTPVLETELDDRGFGKLIVQAPGTAQDYHRTVRECLSSGFEVSFSTSAFCEVTRAGVNKATALHRLVRRLGIENRETVAFGDMPNDLPMLAWAGTAVAVSNAHPDVLAAADEVTAANNDDGVARFLERLTTVEALAVEER